MKKRYIAAALTIAGSIAITPYCFNTAYESRGYVVVGGEYLVIPMALLLVHIILEIAKAWDNYFLNRSRYLRHKGWERGKEKTKKRYDSVWQGGEKKDHR